MNHAKHTLTSNTDIQIHVIDTLYGDGGGGGTYLSHFYNKSCPIHVTEHMGDTKF